MRHDGMNTLAQKTISGFIQLILGLGALLFVPAWTFDFWQAWVYLLVFAASAISITAWLWKHDPRLLAGRVNAGPGAETSKNQNLIQVCASIAFAGMMIVPSLDHRFFGSDIPLLGVLAGDALVALGFLIVFMVFRENSYAVGTIEVAPDQKVVSTGPYAIVRHPMYAGALVMLFGTPLALGSWWGFAVFVPMTLVIVWRLRGEEKFLAEALHGYRPYREQVRYRLVPLIW
jgi:protein-S-isoprenylcysteine O-methyltransferase Ste14